MKVLSLKSTIREAVGKGQARSLRRGGMIPAVLYGKGIESVKLSVDLVDLQQILRTSKTSQFLLNLEVNGLIKKVTVKELQKRPVSSDILHIDFYEVSMDRKIKVNVPISTFGICKGIELGGMLQIIRREVEVICMPDNIPDTISIDITDLDIGDSFHVMDFSSSDEIEISKESNFTILTVLNQKASTEEETDDEDKISEEIESI